MSKRALQSPDPTRQIDAHLLLLGFRKTFLADAMKEAMSRVNLEQLQSQLSEFVPAKARQILAIAGIRDEQIFPTPVLLSVAPQLLGYYRLLLGSPQKSFYAPATGLGQFKSMEVSGALTARHKDNLPELCRVLAVSLSRLTCELSPTITDQDIRELPLLTLGAQLQGARNNLIGKEATEQVFLSIKSLIPRKCISSQSDIRIEIKNSSGRQVLVRLAADPDVRIEEFLEEEWHPKVALEIKGGGDRSNAHNRAGEAEKSHQKAKKGNFTEFWTIISIPGLKLDTLRSESPTTTQWFDVAEIIGRSGPDWDRFKSKVSLALGIPRTNLKRE